MLKENEPDELTGTEHVQCDVLGKAHHENSFNCPES